MPHLSKEEMGHISHTGLAWRLCVTCIKECLACGKCYVSYYWFSCWMLQLCYVHLGHHQQHTQVSFLPQSFLFKQYFLHLIALTKLGYSVSIFPHLSNLIYHKLLSVTTKKNISSPFTCLVFDFHHHMDIFLTSHVAHCPWLTNRLVFPLFSTSVHKTARVNI